jgi:hypothetical protein
MRSTRAARSRGGSTLAIGGCMRAARIALAALLFCLAGCAGDRDEADYIAPDASIASAPDAPHGDHTPRYGGIVFMHGDLHFEVVLDRSGVHRVFFSDATRAELPAAVASEVTVTISRPRKSSETIAGAVDSTGEGWIASGEPVPEADASARVAFVVQAGPYWIDVPFAGTPEQAHPADLDREAAEYVRLARALAERDPDFLPPHPLTTREPHGARRTLRSIANDAIAAARRLRNLPEAAADVDLRARNLIAQLDAVAMRARQLNGERLAFADEMHGLFGVLPPAVHELANVNAVRAALERLLPGPGSLAERVADFESRFVIPPDKFEAVFGRALEGCRARTVARVELPAGEGVTVQYVSHRPWSGYTRYVGSYRSIVQINRSMPLTAGRVLTLACHEAYPGHHTYHVLRDARLARARGWPELVVAPLFTPQGFAAEAAASAAMALAFPGRSRLAVIRDELFPSAGLDPSAADRYVRVSEQLDQLEQAVTGILALYLEGVLDFPSAGAALRAEALMAHPYDTLKFANQYRGYALAYTFGRALVRADTPSAPAADAWRRFTRLAEAPMPLLPIRSAG